MPTDTEIANAALRLIGAERITSLSQGNKNALVASDLYTLVRDDLLRSHNWNFATKRAQLARVSTAPAFEFDYAYAVPHDWARTVSVHDNDGGIGTIVYREENVADQRCILASTEQVYLRYVARVAEGLMPTDFVTALVSALARDMAVPIANSNTLRQLYEKKAASDLLKARSSDALGSAPEKRPVGTWVASRSGWR